MSQNNIKTEVLIHDLKVPVSVIDAGAKSLLNRMETYGPLTEKQIKVLNRIIRNTHNIQRLVNDVLELGRSREGVMVTSDFKVAELVTTVLVELFDFTDPAIADHIRKISDRRELMCLMQEKNIIIDFPAPAWNAVIRQDQSKVSQIFRNLMTNAFKHKKMVVEVKGGIDKKGLHLNIKDDGKGIPESHRTAIFQSYFTTGSNIEQLIKSHGLGLTGVMQLLKDMGGNLSLNSDEGKGSEFIVLIPLK